MILIVVVGCCVVWGIVVVIIYVKGISRFLFVMVIVLWVVFWYIFIVIWMIGIIGVRRICCCYKKDNIWCILVICNWFL